MTDHHHLPNDTAFDASPDVLTATAQEEQRKAEATTSQPTSAAPAAVELAAA